MNNESRRSITSLRFGSREYLQVDVVPLKKTALPFRKYLLFRNQMGKSGGPYPPTLEIITLILFFWVFGVLAQNTKMSDRMTVLVF